MIKVKLHNSLKMTAAAFALAGCWEDDFICDAEGRMLTDLELLESAFAYEVEEQDLPEPYLSLGISGMKKLYRGCCTVEREDNPFNEPRGLLSRMFSDPSVLVVIGWDLKPNRRSSPMTLHFMSLCGTVLERLGDFRPRKYNLPNKP